MKKVILILIFGFFALTGTSQTFKGHALSDDIYYTGKPEPAYRIATIDSINYGKAIMFITNNLHESHSQFKIGTGFFFVGTAGVIIGTVMKPHYDMDNKVKYDGKIAVVAIGGVLQLIGSILWIDSHKWIGRAGRLEWQGDKIVLKF